MVGLHDDSPRSVLYLFILFLLTLYLGIGRRLQQASRTMGEVKSGEKFMKAPLMLKAVSFLGLPPMFPELIKDTSGPEKSNEIYISSLNL